MEDRLLQFYRRGGGLEGQPPIVAGMTHRYLAPSGSR